MLIKRNNCAQDNFVQYYWTFYYTFVITLICFSVTLICIFWRISKWIGWKYRQSLQQPNFRSHWRNDLEFCRFYDQTGKVSIKSDVMQMAVLLTPLYLLLFCLWTTIFTKIMNPLRWMRNKFVLQKCSFIDFVLIYLYR